MPEWLFNDSCSMQMAYAKKALLPCRVKISLCISISMLIIRHSWPSGKQGIYLQCRYADRRQNRPPESGMRARSNKGPQHEIRTRDSGCLYSVVNGN